LDSNGDIAKVESQKDANSALKIYANNIKYNSFGGVEQVRLGNGKFETTQYNNRLQVKQIGLGYSATDKGLLKIDYDYGTATQNNGSLREQKINYNGLSSEIKQTYAYDDLNRVQSATETFNTGTQSWKQTFSYDRFGNRSFDAANTSTFGQNYNQNIANPLINTSDNRISNGQGYGYDKSGNLTQDAEGKRYFYDAENHQTSYFATGNSSITPDAIYEYDGNGTRVRKIVGQVETIFVYNAMGQTVAEYSNQLPVEKKISYLTADHLGSPRIVTDQGGQVVSRHDYMAFGEEVSAGIANRTTAQKYGAFDEIRQQYTGYQRDTESGLDFAQARYYNSKQGRFTSVDPLVASANVKDPQTFNRYSYAMNSPYKFTDPLGLIAQGEGSGQQDDDKPKPKKKPAPPKKPVAKKPAPPPKPAPKPAQNNTPKTPAATPKPAQEVPRPTSATISTDFVGTETGTLDGKNLDYISGRAELTITVLDQNGKPYNGTVTETVTSPGSNVETNKGSETLTDGKFTDLVDVNGQKLPDTSASTRSAVESSIENTPARTQQTATFTVTGPGTTDSLIIVHDRVLTNVDSRTNQINAPKNGTTFRFYSQPPVVTPKPK
jgi:RHS repeat-associated protein